MVLIYKEAPMSIDTTFATAVELLAKEQGRDLRELAHQVMALSNPDVSIREFRRIRRPDTKGRLRNLTLREAYEFSRALGKTVDDMIAYGLTHED